MRKKLLAVALVATACDVPSSLQPLDDAGFERRDAGQITDGGLPHDAGHIVDAGQILDAGQIVDADAGQILDAGQVVVETDAGQPVDAGPTPVECDLLDPPAYEYECRGDEDFCDTSYDERTEAVDVIATWSHRDGDNVFIDVLTRRPVWFVNRAVVEVCVSDQVSTPIFSPISDGTVAIDIPQRSGDLIACNLGTSHSGRVNSPGWWPIPSSVSDCDIPPSDIFLASGCDVSIASSVLFRLRARNPQITHYLASGRTYSIGTRWADITADTTGTDVRFLEIADAPDPFPDLEFVSTCDITCPELGGVAVVTGSGQPAAACRDIPSER